ncbi:uncharacterized protein F4822DRAFT_441916 [Hypoxylon trugodes]|uniref:uncharacterized protein n=1 Tax=Hypoxylon trugodes TaxID=326681 RepID=UPI0021913E07|nr:uncharacterized protein F4822DRAFT_441916 [Hypoxylon trugodes]KAI1390572.1 hypothetical protein F4822DRAFT_441916 [Hypoxylon trugodes]
MPFWGKADEIVRAAIARCDETRRCHLENIPPELKKAILSYAGGSSAVNLALTGPVLYRTIKDDETYAANEIVSGEVGLDLLPLAITRRCAETEQRRYRGVPWDAPARIMAVTNLLIRVTRKPLTRSRLNFCLKEAKVFSDFHSTACRYARIFASKALREGPRSLKPTTHLPSVPDYVLRVTDGEMNRFIKALYIFQMACDLFPEHIERPFLAGRGEDLYEAEKYFWTTFPPWEHQQVRCVQDMMHEHIRDMVSCLPSNEIIGKFVIMEGLSSVQKLSDQGRIEEKLREMEKDDKNEDLEENRSEAWFSETDEPWLLFDVENYEVTMNTREIVERNKDVDLGPVGSWLHTLIQRLLWDPMFLPGKDAYFKCDSCMTRWGYVFWDRNKISWHAYDKMPKIEDMVKLSNGTVFDRNIFMTPLNFTGRLVAFLQAIKTMPSQLSAKKAVRAATKRGDENRRSRLENLANELLTAIIGWSDAADTINLALTGPVMYRKIKYNELYLSTKIAINRIGLDLLLFASSLVATDSWRFWDYDADYPEIQSSFSTFFSKSITAGLSSKKRPFPLRATKKLLSFHETICYYASTFAASAIRKGYYHAETGESVRSEPDFLFQVSSEEEHRFIKALYIWQLGCNLFPRRIKAPGFLDFQAMMFNMVQEGFWTTFAPWEHQQVRCVQEMMYEHLRDVVFRESGRTSSDANIGKVPKGFVYQYMIEEGLQGIRKHEVQGTTVRSLLYIGLYNFEGTTTHLGRLNSLGRHFEEPVGWFSESDEPWMNVDRATKTVSLDTRNIISAFHDTDSDSGPLDAWLYTLLLKRIGDDPIFSTHATAPFWCEKDMSK